MSCTQCEQSFYITGICTGRPERDTGKVRYPALPSPTRHVCVSPSLSSPHPTTIPNPKPKPNKTVPPPLRRLPGPRRLHAERERAAPPLQEVQHGNDWGCCLYVRVCVSPSLGEKRERRAENHQQSVRRIRWCSSRLSFNNRNSTTMGARSARTPAPARRSRPAASWPKYVSAGGTRDGAFCRSSLADVHASRFSLSRCGGGGGGGRARAVTFGWCFCFCTSRVIRRYLKGGLPFESSPILILLLLLLFYAWTVQSQACQSVGRRDVALQENDTRSARRPGRRRDRLIGWIAYGMGRKTKWGRS